VCRGAPARADYEYMFKNDPVTGRVGTMSATNLMSSGGRTGGRARHYGYRHGAEFLRNVREKLQVAQKLDPREV
jgi:hypothetical protein